MKKEKLGFFKKLFLAITDFRTYPFLVKHEKFLKSILYLVTLTLFISLIFSINIFLKFNQTINNIIENYDEKIPEFEFSNGNLVVDSKYNEKIDSESFLVIDTNYTYEEYKETKEYSSLVIYDVVTLVNSDKIMIEIGGEPLYEVSFQNLEYKINKDSLYSEITKKPEALEYILYLITLYISIFIGYFVAILSKILFLACIILIICFFTGVRLNFKNYIKIAIYAYSLPVIIELLSLCLGVSTKDYVYYTTSLLTYIYIIYAIRAIRLDAFIMMFSNKTNVKHTSIEFENELKKYNEIVNNDVSKSSDTKNNETKDKENEDESKNDNN